MKKNIKIILILLLIIVALINNTVFAKDVIDPKGYTPGSLNKKDASKVITIAGKILAVVRNIGIIISVIVLSIIGLKYMMCSVDEKANYKENMTPYVVGCLLLAMSTTIPSIIYDVLN